MGNKSAPDPIKKHEEEISRKYKEIEEIKKNLNKKYFKLNNGETTYSINIIFFKYFLIFIF
jgi:hypothetical protein